MTELPALIAAFTTIFIIIDPPGLAPLYIALTQGMGAAQRRAIGLRACLVAGVLMLLFLFLGEAVLRFIGISMPAFRIAGGVLLFITALDMLFERRQTRRKGNADEGADPGHDPSVFPLAIPLIVGPGLITTIILLAGQATSAADFAAITAVMAANLIIVFLFFLASGTIERILGKVGINVVTRILGMLLAALAVQFILDGLRSFGFSG
ncbi:MAG: MarC family protein [Rhodobacterales bacterium]|nr:MarC family protein [Rhodobacterales bacterium]NCT13126.1 MarC family protein [Rhodobacterales bacterium]